MSKRADMLTVSLKGIRLYASVGLYPEEAFLKQEIEVNVSVSQKADINELPFIDYVILHNIIKEAVAEPTSLLETIVQRIVERVRTKYPDTGIKLAVRKMHPPLSGIVDYSEVLWES